jgi:alpha-galactosidase
VYGPDIDEGRILAVADAMVDTGMHDVGREYVMLDDGWQRTRGSRFQHDLEHDPDTFPRGIGFLTDAVHECGLKLGIYSGPGVETCAGYTGSGGHEREDAEPFASWGVEPEVRLVLLAGQGIARCREPHEATMLRLSPP